MDHWGGEPHSLLVGVGMLVPAEDFAIFEVVGARPFGAEKVEPINDLQRSPVFQFRQQVVEGLAATPGLGPARYQAGATERREPRRHGAGRMAVRLPGEGQPMEHSQEHAATRQVGLEVGQADPKGLEEQAATRPLAGR